MFTLLEFRSEDEIQCPQGILALFPEGGKLLQA